MEDNFNVYKWNKKRYLTEGLSEDQTLQRYKFTDKGVKFLQLVEAMLNDPTFDLNQEFDENFIDNISYAGLGLDTKEFIRMLVAGGLARPEA